MSLYRHRWRLEYPGGRVIDEPPVGVSIKTAPDGASLLIIIDCQTGRQVYGCPLNEDGIQWRPVVYRRRSIGLNSGELEPRTDALVVGRARPALDGGVEFAIFRFNVETQQPELAREHDLDLTAIAWLAGVGNA